jgi:RND superfamily putative drug exporter
VWSIVSAAMSLLDRAAWWLPRWLDRIVPNVDIEGEHLMAQLELAADIDASAEQDVSEEERELADA